MPLAVHVQMMDLGVEGIPHLPGRARKIDYHAARVHRVHGEALRLQPGRYRVDIVLRRAELAAELRRGHPLVIVGRFAVVQLIDILAGGQLLLRRTLHLQQHMLHRKAVGHAALVILLVGFGREYCPSACACGRL